jgi:hypothetical protein
VYVFLVFHTKSALQNRTEQKLTRPQQNLNITIGDASESTGLETMAINRNEFMIRLGKE